MVVWYIRREEYDYLISWRKNSKAKRTGEKMKINKHYRKNYCSCQFNRQTRCVDNDGKCDYCGLEVDEWR